MISGKSWKSSTLWRLTPTLPGIKMKRYRVIEVFNSTLKRIGKELNNTNIQLEEVLAQCMDTGEKDKRLAALIWEP